MVNGQTDNIFGFLNVYKPTGMTSHDVISVLRKITKIKQIGHAGTLDPFAQGVLPVAIGKTTRLIEFLEGEKKYLAEITFGKSTDTYDCEGAVTAELHSAVTAPQIKKALKQFEGEILQMPPIYSAIKVKGKKLYEYARKGEEVAIEPRRVFIEKIELKAFDEKEQKAQVLIKCSKGTYIRSIAHDLGQNLGVGAHLSMLIRTQAGNFFVQDAVPLDEIKIIQDVEKKLINPICKIDLNRLEITEDEHKKILMGQAITRSGLNSKNVTFDDVGLESPTYFDNSCFLNSLQYNKNNLQNYDFIILIYNNNISAIAQIYGNQIRVKKVFI